MNYREEVTAGNKYRLERLSKSAFGNTAWYEYKVFDGYHEFIKDNEFVQKSIDKI